MNGTIIENNQTLIKVLTSISKKSDVKLPTYEWCLDYALAIPSFELAAKLNVNILSKLPKKTRRGSTAAEGRISTFMTEVFEEMAVHKKVTVDEVRLWYKPDDSSMNLRLVNVSDVELFIQIVEEKLGLKK